MTIEEQRKILRNIKKLRDIRGYKQKYIAGYLGVEQNTYSKIENGEIKLTEERLEKIAKALETTIEAIKYFDEKKVFDTNYSLQRGGDLPSTNSQSGQTSADETIRKMVQEMIGPLAERILAIEERLKILEGKIG